MRCVKSVIPHDGWSNSSSPGRPALGSPPSRASATRARGQVVGLDGQLGAALLEVVLDAGLGELVGQLARLLDGMLLNAGTHAGASPSATRRRSARP
jgi:hypothetical protein